jgi:hypothetical protein
VHVRARWERIGPGGDRMKRRCCRSTPRCAGCPVLVAAQRRNLGTTPDLFAEILGGRPARTLPESVVRALEELDRRAPVGPAPDAAPASHAAPGLAPAPAPAP